MTPLKAPLDWPQCSIFMLLAVPARQQTGTFKCDLILQCCCGLSDLSCLPQFDQLPPSFNKDWTRLCIWFMHLLWAYDSISSLVLESLKYKIYLEIQPSVLAKPQMNANKSPWGLHFTGTTSLLSEKLKLKGCCSLTAVPHYTQIALAAAGTGDTATRTVPCSSHCRGHPSWHWDHITPKGWGIQQHCALICSFCPWC